VQAGRRRGDSDQELLEPQPTPNTHHSGTLFGSLATGRVHSCVKIGCIQKLRNLE
jgi:hypothetical protein